MNHKLKLALDLGPLALFFIGYRVAGLAAATCALIAATLGCCYPCAGGYFSSSSPH